MTNANIYCGTPSPEKQREIKKGEKLAVLDAQTGLKGTMVKVLIAGDVKGSVPQLLARVAQHHK